MREHVTIQQGKVTLVLRKDDAGRIVATISARGDVLRKRIFPEGRMIELLFGRSLVPNLEALMYPKSYKPLISVTCAGCGEQFHTKTTNYICPTCHIEVVFDPEVDRKQKEKM